MCEPFLNEGNKDIIYNNDIGYSRRMFNAFVSLLKEVRCQQLADFNFLFIFC